MLLALSVALMALLPSMMVTDAIRGLLTDAPKREVLLYARVSGKKQKKGLQDQVDSMKNDLKKMGVKRIKVFSEIVSGAKRIGDRPQLQAMVDYAFSKPAGATAIVVRDAQRFSRDPYMLGAIYDPLRVHDVPLVSFGNGGLIASTDMQRQPAGDLLIPILSTLGKQEVDIGRERSERGTEFSREQGIFSGTPIELYPKEALNPYTELMRLIPVVAAGKMSQRDASKRLGKSTSWFRKAKERIAGIRDLGGDYLKDWLEVLNEIRDMEVEHGKGWGKKPDKRMAAVRRMTGGYMDQPNNFPRPTSDDLMEYFTNYKLYRAKKTSQFR